MNLKVYGELNYAPTECSSYPVCCSNFHKDKSRIVLTIFSLLKASKTEPNFSDSWEVHPPKIQT